jgi:hypothetical protein
MFKKITLIIILSVALGAFLVLRPYIFKKTETPAIVDRLPDADFMGRAFILDVARETSGMLFYHKIPYRDLFSYEFILSQGKMYGLNFQNPVYLFANENGNWGAMIEVTDSSKIAQGIERIQKLMPLGDTTINGQRIYTLKKEKGYLTYGKNFLFVYKGTEFETTLNHVLQAKRKGITNTWKKFLKEKQFKNEKLVLYSNWEKLKANGVETAIFAHDSDSISFSLMAYVRNKKPLSIKMKESGKNLQSGEFTNKMLNVHLDITKLRNDPTDPLHQFMVKMGKKIGFPTREFLQAWEGDLSMRQGGFQIVKEKYIQSELDEDFNVTEVEVEKEVKVPGFSLLFSVNKNGKTLLNRLLDKGILTQEQSRYRFLFSPELYLKKTGDYFIFHSGERTPKTEESNGNFGHWTQNGTRLEFRLDSLSRYEVFGTIYIPIEKIVRKNRFL